MTKASKIVVGVIVLILILALWLVPQKAREQAAAEPLYIGVIAPLTGDFADYGEEIRKGVVAGATSTPNVRFVFEDDRCEAKEAVTAFQKLVSVDKVKFVIGPGCGSPQEAIVPLLEQNRIVVMVPSAASKSLASTSAGYFFNIQYSLEDESKFIAERMNEAGYKNVALVTYANAFSKAHGDSFCANFKGNIVVDTVFVENNANIQTELTKIKAAKADAIYSPDVTFFFAGATMKLKQLGIKAPVYTTYVAELPAVIPLVEGVTYSFPGDIDSAGGAVYNLSKQTVEALVPAILECASEPLCVKSKLSSSQKFDGDGVYKREIVLKQIVGGAATSTKKI